MSRLFDAHSLGRRKELRRTKRINPVNRARRKKRRQQTFGPDERVRWMQQLNCLACGRTPCQVAHVKSRGAGGTADDTVPLCAHCHRRQHDLGIKTFAALHFLDLEEEASKYARWWAEGLESGAFDLGF